MTSQVKRHGDLPCLTWLSSHVLPLPSPLAQQPHRSDHASRRSRGHWATERAMKLLRPRAAKDNTWPAACPPLEHAPLALKFVGPHHPCAPPPPVTPTFLLAQLLDSTDVNVVVDGGAGELGGGVDLQCRGVRGGGEGV